MTPSIIEQWSWVKHPVTRQSPRGEGPDGSRSKTAPFRKAARDYSRVQSRAPPFPCGRAEVLIGRRWASEIFLKSSETGRVRRRAVRKNRRSPTFLPLLQKFPINSRHRSHRIPGIGDGGVSSHRAPEVANGRGAAIKLTEISGRSISSTPACGPVVPVQDFLNQRAVNVVVDGHYTLPNWYDPQGKLRTFACRTTRVSPFRMIVEVPVVGKVGDRLTSYFRDFGKFEGSISDTMQGSFLLELEMTRARREKLSDMLTWMEKKQKDSTIIDLRR